MSENNEDIDGDPRLSEMLCPSRVACPVWDGQRWVADAKPFYYCVSCHLSTTACPARYEDGRVDSTKLLRPVARELRVEQCSKSHAVNLTRRWHSRLPKTQKSPWQYAFKAVYAGKTYAVALWLNPSARTLPGHWLELRRMACAPDAPPYTASRMLGVMTHYFESHHREREKCISYQDISVHKGTIYRAANWTPEYFSRPRKRDRAKNRVGTKRLYRSDINSQHVAAAGKIRWAYTFGEAVDHKLVKERLREYMRLAEKCVVSK